jgi:hypothetical protein
MAMQVLAGVKADLRRMLVAQPRSIAQMHKSLGLTPQ